MNAKTAIRVRWFIGLAAITLLLSAILIFDVPVLFYHKLPFFSFFRRCFLILLIAAMFCLYRVLRGPTAADRIVAIDILGVLIVGFCAIIEIPTGRSWYVDIAIAWALQSFIATLALAKYLEGKNLDE